MTIEEKVNAMFEYVRYDYLLAVAVHQKDEAVRKQDFKSAVAFRDKEVELRKQRWAAFSKVFNSEPDVQETDTTGEQETNK